MRLCEFCNKEIDGGFGTGRFCNRSCAGKFAVKNHFMKGKTYEELYGLMIFSD